MICLAGNPTPEVGSSCSRVVVQRPVPHSRGYIDRKRGRFLSKVTSVTSTSDIHYSFLKVQKEEMGSLIFPSLFIIHRSMLWCYVPVLVSYAGTQSKRYGR